jgi:thiol-disulfide isomerase/thioredoxin
VMGKAVLWNSVLLASLRGGWIRHRWKAREIKNVRCRHRPCATRGELVQSMSRVLIKRLLLVFVLLVLSNRPMAVCREDGTACAQSSAGAADQSHTLPVFMLSDLQNRRHKTADFRSNIVVLDFWATWCVPCIEEIPIFNQLQEKYRAQRVRVIGLAVQSGWRKDIKRFLDKHKMRYTILVGTNDTVADFDVISLPTTFLIAPGWRTYKKYTGAYEGKAAEIERDVKELLHQKQ